MIELHRRAPDTGDSRGYSGATDQHCQGLSLRAYHVPPTLEPIVGPSFLQADAERVPEIFRVTRQVSDQCQVRPSKRAAPISSHGFVHRRCDCLLELRTKRRWDALPLNCCLESFHVSGNRFDTLIQVVPNLQLTTRVNTNEMMRRDHGRIAWTLELCCRHR